MVKKLIITLLFIILTLPAVSATYYYNQNAVEFEISNNTLIIGGKTELITSLQTFYNYTVVNTYTIIPFTNGTTFIIDSYPATPYLRHYVEYSTWRDYGGHPHSRMRVNMYTTYIVENPQRIIIAVNGTSTLLDRYFAYPFEPPNVVRPGGTHTTRVYVYSSGSWVLWRYYGTYSKPQFGGPYWNRPTVHTVDETLNSYFITLSSEWTFSQPGYYYGRGVYLLTFTQRITINDTSYTQYQYTRNYHHWCIVGCDGGSYTYWKTWYGKVVIITTSTTIHFTGERTYSRRYYRWYGTRTSIILTNYNSRWVGVIHTAIIRTVVHTRTIRNTMIKASAMFIPTSSKYTASPGNRKTWTYYGTYYINDYGPIPKITTSYYITSYITYASYKLTKTYISVGSGTETSILGGYISAKEIFPGVYYVYSSTHRYTRESYMIYVYANSKYTPVESLSVLYCRYCYYKYIYYLNRSYINPRVSEISYSRGITLNANYSGTSKITVDEKSIVTSNKTMIVFTTNTTTKNTLTVHGKTFVFTNTISATITAKASNVEIKGVFLGPLNPVTLRILTISWYILLSIILIVIAYYAYKYAREGDKYYIYRAAIAASVPIIIKITVLIIDYLTGGG